MKITLPNPYLPFGFLVTVLLTTAITAQCDDAPTLKDAYKGDFYVGVAIGRNIYGGGRPRGGNFGQNPAGAQPQAAPRESKELTLVKQQYNQISPENDLKWDSIQPREGADGYNFGPADAYVDFGVKNNMYIVGHTLVWHSQTPQWVFAAKAPEPGAVPAGATTPGALPVGAPAAAGATPAHVPNPFLDPPPADPAFGGFGGGANNDRPRATREELLQRMKDHIFTVVGRYKGKIKVWDVVNEALSDGGPNVLRDSPWSQIIGPDFIAKAFEYAHEADPDAILRYNDYGLENPAKRQKLITLIKGLLAQKVPVMAIGTQTHVSVTGPSFEEEDRALTEIESLGLPIHVTELDVNSSQGGQRNFGANVADNAAATQGGIVDDADKRLADQYGNLFKAFLKHKNSVKVVTLWGINDATSWRANGKPLLFDGNNEPKPAFTAVIQAAQGN